MGQPIQLQHWQRFALDGQLLPGLLDFYRVNGGVWNEPAFDYFGPAVDNRQGIAGSFNQNVTLNVGEYLEASFDWSGGGGNNSGRQIRWGFFNGSQINQDGHNTLISARYWRIIIDQINTQPSRLSSFVLRNIVQTMFTPNNMTDNNTPAPFVADTNATGNAFHVFDGTTNFIELNAGEWVSIDLGGNNQASIGNVSWQSGAAYHPIRFRVQYSFDNIDWNNIYTYDDILGECPESLHFGLDDVTRDWVGFGQGIGTRNSFGRLAFDMYYQGDGNQELANYAQNVPTRVNGRILTTGNQVVGINQDTVHNIKVKITRVQQNTYALETAHINSGTVCERRSGSTGDNLLIYNSIHRITGDHFTESVFRNFTIPSFNGFAVFARANFTIDNFSLIKGSLNAININFGGAASIACGAVSSNTPAHAEGTIPLDNNKWNGTLRTDFNAIVDSFALIGRTGMRRGTARANGAQWNSFIVWGQNSNNSDQSTTVVGTGIFQNNPLTQSFMTYSRVGNFRARPVGAIYQGLAVGTYDVYVVAHNNNSLHDSTGDSQPDIISANLQNNKLVVGIGVTQDTRANDPNYAPYDSNLDWVDLSVVPDDSAWIEGNNYAKSRITITSQTNDWLYIQVHYAHENSEQFRVAGISFVQIIKIS